MDSTDYTYTFVNAYTHKHTYTHIIIIVKEKDAINRRAKKAMEGVEEWGPRERLDGGIQKGKLREFYFP